MSGIARSLIVVAGLVTIVAGCGCRNGRPQDPVVNASDPAPFVAEAEETIAKSRELDFRAPRDRAPREVLRRSAIGLYLEACKLGDRRSCWRAAVAQGDGSLALLHEAVVATGKNCQGGDAMSCRALVSDDLRDLSYWRDDDQQPAIESCESGLAAACVAAAQGVATPEEQTAWFQRGCELGDAASCHRLWDLAVAGGASEVSAALHLARALDADRRECELGFARSCQALWTAGHGEAQRVVATADEGCRAGLLDECLVLYFSEATPAQRAYGLEQVCTSWGQLCDTLAGLRTDPIEVRDAYEHGCQLEDDALCLELARRYLAKELPEPVPDRGADLADYLCTTRAKPEACSLLGR